MAESIPVQDLRSFLQLVEDKGELATIKSSVSLNQEIGAVCLRNLRTSGPGLLFERAGDHERTRRFREVNRALAWQRDRLRRLLV